MICLITPLAHRREIDVSQRVTTSKHSRSARTHTRPSISLTACDVCFTYRSDTSALFPTPALLPVPAGTISCATSIACEPSRCSPAQPSPGCGDRRARASRSPTATLDAVFAGGTAAVYGNRVLLFPPDARASIAMMLRHAVRDASQSVHAASLGRSSSHSSCGRGVPVDTVASLARYTHFTTTNGTWRSGRKAGVTPVRPYVSVIGLAIFTLIVAMAGTGCGIALRLTRGRS